MTTDYAEPEDPSDVYDVGGYNALLSVRYTYVEEPEDATYTLTQVCALLDDAMEMIVSIAAEQGRDLSPFLVPLEDLDELLDD